MPKNVLNVAKEAKLRQIWSHCRGLFSKALWLRNYSQMVTLNLHINWEHPINLFKWAFPGLFSLFSSFQMFCIKVSR